MKLRTLNRWLDVFGLVLIVVMSDDDPDGYISFRLMTWKGYLFEFVDTCQCWKRAPGLRPGSRCPGPVNPDAKCGLCGKGFPPNHQA